jgi:uncharacterized protein (TIGR00255 family)
MIRSMTGFGKAVSENSEKKITVEVRSLNSKQMDLNVRIPSLFREKENEVRNAVQKLLERGKVDVSVNQENNVEQKTIAINRELAKNYYCELAALSEELETGPVNYVEIISRMPEVWKQEKSELHEEDWELVQSALEKALAALNVFRRDEGKVLGKELSTRINNIVQNLATIEKLDATRIQHIRSRIKGNLDELVPADRVDVNRFEQELIYYMEKIDITEEKLRLSTHCAYFLKTMEEMSSGRKLGFISQELGREINTIGSKANDAAIQKLVVEMKDELEKIKEQLLNVL